ncbi:hypothetical protein [Streptomyces sp. NPDC048644]|uniref:hypothetical protein n=1 Tax=Streptomyces sp. NPDC048644 TaxID=3365582 RepID=UPI00372214F0
MSVPEVKPKDVGTLAIEYRDGQPVLVVRGGKAILAQLAVVDASANRIAVYVANSASQTEADALELFDYGFPENGVQFYRASEVKPEEIGSLTLEYQDSQPVIVVSGGRVIPAELQAVSASGTTVAGYTATQSRNSYRNSHTGDNYIVLNTYKPQPDADKF